MMALLSSISPPIGLFGCVISYISSDNPDAGERFIIDLATMNLPGGFATNFLSNVLTDVFLGSQLPSAMGEITPYNKIALFCHNCQQSTHYYVRRNGKAFCSDCVGRSLSNKVYHNDKTRV